MIPSTAGQEESVSDGERFPHAAVLIVDDDATNRLILGGLLQSHGYRTFTAPGGLQALRLMSKQRFWAVFVDIRMPDIDGFETVRRMRRLNLPHNPAAARVIGVSASIEKEAQAKAEGFDAFLPKPVQGADLSNILNKLIKDELGVKQQPLVVA